MFRLKSTHTRSTLLVQHPCTSIERVLSWLQWQIAKVSGLTTLKGTKTMRIKHHLLRKWKIARETMTITGWTQTQALASDLTLKAHSSIRPKTRVIEAHASPPIITISSSTSILFLTTCQVIIEDKTSRLQLSDCVSTLSHHRSKECFQSQTTRQQQQQMTQWMQVWQSMAKPSLVPRNTAESWALSRTH